MTPSSLIRDHGKKDIDNSNHCSFIFVFSRRDPLIGSKTLSTGPGIHTYKQKTVDELENEEESILNASDAEEEILSQNTNNEEES